MSGGSALVSGPVVSSSQWSQVPVHWSPGMPEQDTGDFNGQSVLVCWCENMDLSSCAQHMARVTWSGGVRSHGDHLYSSLSSLQSSSVLVDVSLVSDAGAEVMCHKIVLASASHLLRQLFQDNDEKVSHTGHDQ